jgi:pyruvate,water dikinase
MPILIPLDQAADCSLQAIGAKAWRLGVAGREGLAVPDLMVIPHECLEAHWSDLQVCLSEELHKRFDLEHTVFAVRSSSNAEDLSYASAAGIFESVLGVRGMEEIIRAVEECNRALHSETARKYMQRLDNDSLQMNIIIQELITPRRAGVLITGRPGSDQFIAEGAWGLAVDIVSGMTNPDFLTASLQEGRNYTVRKGDQKTVCLPTVDGKGIYYREKNRIELDSEIFDEAFIIQLAAIADRVRTIFGGDQEVEWAEDNNGKLWLIQSRPFANKNSLRAPG